MPELGRAALVATLGLALYAVVAGSIAAWKGRRRLAVSARNALIGAFVTSAVASVVLLVALIRHDFSFVYVAQHTSRELPTGYTISAFWGGQEGSLLLWLLILTGYGAAAVLLNRRTRDLVAWVVPVVGAVAVFFSFLVAVVATPFAAHAAPADGAGLNPSLQNPYMMAHPPLLYLGYVGLTIPFAFAMGALLARRTDERWIVATRRWTLVAWTALGIGQLLGAHWAYEEVGWGGYYAWDPVENAALMPWLAATAFLHSVMIQEKRGMLRVWNVVLVIGAFFLSIFGTFLTRSGILSSIHAFTESDIGPWFLAFMGIGLGGSLALLFARLPLLRARTRLESLVSREATFLYNNLLLVALTLTILWGVAYPLVYEAVIGESRIVGRGYYDFFVRAFGLPLLLLMGIGPLVAWRRASLRSLALTFAWPAGAALVGGRHPARARGRLVHSRPDRVHVLHVRARHDRAGVHPRHARPPRSLRRLVGGRLLGARRAQPPALRRLRRPRRHRPARDRDRRVERLRQGCRREARARPVARSRRLPAHLPLARRA